MKLLIQVLVGSALKYPNTIKLSYFDDCGFFIGFLNGSLCLLYLDCMNN